MALIKLAKTRGKSLLEKETYKKHPIAATLSSTGILGTIGGIGLHVHDMNSMKKVIHNPRGLAIALGSGLIALSALKNMNKKENK